MKFKPFYIEYESWMTDEEVQEVLDKAVSAGANYDNQVESVTGFTMRSFNPKLWVYFGVGEDFVTMCSDLVIGFGEGAVLLTLDQVDSHLGLTKPEVVTDTVVNTPKSLANVKLDCRKPDGSVDEELSRAFQEACFGQGIGWATSGKTVKYEGSHFLFVEDDDLKLRYAEDFEYFKDHANTEIKFTYERKLTWEYEIVAKEEPAERKVVTIGGVEYYEDMIAPLLEAMQSAKVGSGDKVVSPMAGSGNPPDKKDN